MLNKTLRGNIIYLAIFIILLIGLFLRFYKIGDIPSFHADEAAFGYNAYSMLLTGKDESGVRFPLGLTSFNDYRPPLYAYLDIPFIKIGGLTVLATRMPSVIFSILSLFLMFILAYLLTRSREIAIYTLLLSAFSFWDIALSREASEKVVAQSFFLLGLILMLFSFQKKNFIYLGVGFFSWFLSINTYYSPRFFIPLFIPLIYIFFSKEIIASGKKLFLAIALGFIALVIFFTFFLGKSTERLNQLSIFKHPQVTLQLEEQIREDGSSEVSIAQTRAFHNKVVNYFLLMSKNYSEYFTADFLFFSGGLPMRIKIPDTGLLPIAESIWLLLGIYFILIKKKRWGIFVLIWLLIAPIPAALTTDETPNAYRAFPMLPALTLIASTGIFYLRTVIRSHILLFSVFASLAILFSANILYYLHQYFLHQQVHQPWYRDFAYKELVSEVNIIQKDYRQVMVTKGQGAPYLFFLFYSSYDPAIYQREGSPKDREYKGFGKYIFHPQDCPLSGGKNGDETVKGEVGVLYVNKGTCVTPLYNAKVLKTIRWQDSSPAFQILEYVSTESANLK